MNDFCSLDLDIKFANGNATFTGTCVSAEPIQWCAFAIAKYSDAMFPAEVFMLLSNPDGTVVSRLGCREIVSSRLYLTLADLALT